MTSRSLARPGFERWDRPSTAPFSASNVHPGRLAQGPDEKLGLVGRISGGCKCVDMADSSKRWRSLPFRGWDGAEDKAHEIPGIGIEIKDWTGRDTRVLCGTGNRRCDPQNQARIEDRRDECFRAEPARVASGK